MLDFLALNNLNNKAQDNLAKIVLNQKFDKKRLYDLRESKHQTIHLPSDYEISISSRKNNIMRNASNFRITIEENSDGSFQFICRQPDWIRIRKSYPRLYFTNIATNQKADTEGSIWYINQRIERSDFINKGVELVLKIYFPPTVIQWFEKVVDADILNFKLISKKNLSKTYKYTSDTEISFEKTYKYTYEISHSSITQSSQAFDTNYLRMIQSSLEHGKWVKKFIHLSDFRNDNIRLTKAYIKNINLSNADDILELETTGLKEVKSHSKLNEDFSKTLLGYGVDSKQGYILSPRQKTILVPKLVLEYSYKNSSNKIVLEYDFKLNVPQPLIDEENGQLNLYANSSKTSLESSSSLADYTLLDKKMIAKIIKSNMSLKEIIEMSKYSNEV